MSSLEVHLLILAVNAYGLGWDLLYLSDVLGKVRLFHQHGYAGRLKFLTFWCQLLQTIYFGVAVLNDVFGSNSYPNDDQKKRSGLQKLRDIMLTSLAFPIGAFVVFSFWGIYAVDRELVFPKVLDAIFPPWLNHIMHTTPIVFCIIEMYLVYHPYPSRRKGMSICVSFALIYQVWIFFIAFYANFWVYPVLAVLSWTGRFGFLAVCWVFLVIFYRTGEFITNKLWNVPPRTEMKKIS